MTIVEDEEFQHLMIGAPPPRPEDEAAEARRIEINKRIAERDFDEDCCYSPDCPYSRGSR